MLEIVLAYWVPIAAVIGIGAAIIAYIVSRRRARKQGLDDIYPMF